MKNNQQGLTLIEVMLAVAILAIALSALVSQTGKSINALSYLEKKTYSYWVAINQLNQFKLEQAWPSIGIVEGNENMAGHNWYWDIKTSNTQSPDLRRLDIQVKTNKTDTGANYQLSTFIAKPFQKPANLILN